MELGTPEATAYVVVTGAQVIAETARFLSREARVAIGVKQLVIATPTTAGVEWTETVPGGEQWHVLCGHATYTSSAAGSNRLVGLTVTIDGQRVWRHIDNSVVAISSTIEYVISANPNVFSQGHGNGFGYLYLPEIILPPGAVVSSNTSTLDAADQWSAVNLWVERYYFTDNELEVVAEHAQKEYLAEMGSH